MELNRVGRAHRLREAACVELTSLRCQVGEVTMAAKGAQVPLGLLGAHGLVTTLSLSRGLPVMDCRAAPQAWRDETVVRERAAADLDRAYHPAGFARQYAAIIAAPDRRTRLAQIGVPTVVLHGADDPLVPVEAGRDTAANIPGAELEIVEGMGHDIPPALYGRVIAAIHRAAERASAETAAQ